MAIVKELIVKELIERKRDWLQKEARISMKRVDTSEEIRNNWNYDMHYANNWNKS